MTREETIAVLAQLRAGCPQSYLKLTEEDANGMVALWQELFAETPAALVSAAIKTYLWNSTNSYFPSIGAIREQVEEIEHICDRCSYGFTLHELMGDETNKYPKTVQETIEKVYKHRYKERYGLPFCSQTIRAQRKAALAGRTAGSKALLEGTQK